MATAATSAERIARVNEYAPDVDTNDLELLDAVVTNLAGALDKIDGDSLLSPGEQLAVLAVAVVRGVLPLLRQERDAQLDKAEARLPQAAE
jgi:hypothetical protein